MCLPNLINLSELKDDMQSIAYICYFNAINLLQNSTLIKTPPDLLEGYKLKKKHLIDHPFPMNNKECPTSMS